MARELITAFAATIFSTVVFATSLARADDRRDVDAALEIDPKVASSLDRESLAASLRIELGSADAQAVDHIAIVPAEGGVSVTVVLKQEKRSSIVPLADAAPASRARVLAIAIAELVRRAPVPARVDTTPKETPASTTPPTPNNAAPRAATPNDDAPRVGAILEGGARFAATGGRLMPLGRIHGFVLVGPSVVATLAFAGGIDRATDTLGTATLLTGEGSVSVAAVVRSGSSAFDLGPRLSLGVARGSGTAGAAAAGSAATTWIALAGATARWRVPERSRVFAAFSVGADYALHGLELRAEDRRILGVSGLSVDLGVGVGIRITP